MNQPSSVRHAVILLVFGFVLSVVSVSFNVVNAPEHYSRPIMIGYGTVRLLLVAGLIYLLYRGKNWARIVYAVFGVISLVTNFRGPNPVGVHHNFVVINHWVGLAITGIALTLLFLPASTQWFVPNKAHT